ncbi:trans-aconitate 2-methyltransferase [Cellulomonas chitinilytica]|uniref:Trans-aconitate 2-methyltransferase n=1 Tax=Cellulomonas chitinilytica TaxID=398759 RepID=A0A919P1T9_9CELL|nr:methyltransferase domain-containing protein [Cellulomonas chitinilytica]GIG20582.1 trans-aconitate 2-methyltransferase [Cellulomonas chitinilytica]
MWDPHQYALFGTHRGRPFADLLARVDAPAPALVVDLGCGDGPLTLGLAQRWPDARVVGIDSSPQMLAAARSHDTDGRVEWTEASAEDWDPTGLGAPIDVLVTNATLQWVPTHRALVPRWVDALAPGGWFAMQVPDNYDAPSHRLMREVAARHARAADLLPALERSAGVVDPGTYLGDLAALGLDADVWRTTYLHVLDPAGAQRSPVLEWVTGTGLRPVLGMLTDEAERAAYLDDYVAELDRAYPRRPWGVVLEFSRIFAVGRRTGPEVERP